MTPNAKLIWIKMVHTIVWVFFVTSIFFIIYSGISGKVSSLTWIAIALVLGEGLVLMIFRWQCPLTVVARRYSDSQRHNFDIYLPEWLAKHNKTIFTALFFAGVVAVAFRILFR